VGLGEDPLSSEMGKCHNDRDNMTLGLIRRCGIFSGEPRIIQGNDADGFKMAKGHAVISCSRSEMALLTKHCLFASYVAPEEGQTVQRRWRQIAILDRNNDEPVNH